MLRDINRSEATIAAEPRTIGRRALLLIGSIGPLGHVPASGTVTVAVVGIPLTGLMRSSLSPTTYVVVTVLFSLVAVWLHQVGDRLLGEKDSRKLVWDELAGFFVAAVIVPWTWQMVTCTFFIQRALDIAKVPPANWIERRVPGGAGVVGDDLIAGLYAMLIMLGVERTAGAYPSLGALLGIGG